VLTGIVVWILTYIVWLANTDDEWWISKMNGAELPCGSAIGVQPADMNYKKTRSEKFNSDRKSKLLSVFLVC
jgi:hypothetical protein